MQVIQLTRESFNAYTRFHTAMWPLHDAVGDWEIVLNKYFANPHSELCAGSGLYACVDSHREICGIAGAYPMPITLNGQLHPGHMLVDWAVLPRFWTGPHHTTNFQGKLIAAKLFAEVLSLPGRKYGSYGSAHSQLPLERRGMRVPAVVAASILSPVNAALLEYLHLRNFAQPSPIAATDLALPGTAQTISPEEFPLPEPTEPKNTAFVQRDSRFWSSYFQSRNHHGAAAFCFKRDGATGYMVCNLLECGRIRFAVLLALHFDTQDIAIARRLGKCAREAMAKLNVSLVIATEADKYISTFLNSMGRWVIRKDKHWWAIPKHDDTFRVEDVRWFLTSADRDAIWSPGLQARPAVAESALLAQ